MTELELLEQLHVMISDTIRETFDDLGIKNKVKPGLNAFKKTEQILWNYNSFCDLVNLKKEQIKELLENGVSQKSKSIVEYAPNSGYEEGLKGTEEQTLEVVNVVQNEIDWINECLYRVNAALEAIKNEPDYPLVTRYYFNGELIGDLAVEMKIDISTATKRKNKLIRKMSMYLFPKDVVGEMFEV